jgi:hypothetical protein
MAKTWWRLPAKTRLRQVEEQAISHQDFGHYFQLLAAQPQLSKAPWKFSHGDRNHKSCKVVVTKLYIHNMSSIIIPSLAFALRSVKGPKT